MDELDKYMLDTANANTDLKIYELIYTYINNYNTTYTQYVQVIASSEDKAIESFKNRIKRNIIDYKVSRILSIYDGLIL